MLAQLLDLELGTVLALGEGPVQQSRKNLECTLVRAATIARYVGSPQEFGSAESVVTHSLVESGSLTLGLAMPTRG